MRTTVRSCCWQISVIVLLAGCAPLAAQTVTEKPAAAQAQPSSEPAHKSKATRTWTDDNITSLRTPADMHMANKAAEAEKAAADSQSEAQKKAAGSGANACQLGAKNCAPQLPDKPEAVEALIAKTEQDINRKGKTVEQASVDARQATNETDRSAMESNLEIAKVDLQASKDDLKLLQARLAQLKSESGTDSASGDVPAKSP